MHDIAGEKPCYGVLFRCPCGQGIWAESSWSGMAYAWHFFREAEDMPSGFADFSPEELNHCPGCGRVLKFEALEAYGR